MVDPKQIVMKGFCRTVTEEDYIFDREYYPDGMRNGRIYFRCTRTVIHVKSVNIYCVAEVCVPVTCSTSLERETPVITGQEAGSSNQSRMTSTG